MVRTPQPGGPPAAAAASGQPHIRRAVALPLHEGDLDGAAVSEALTRVGAPAAGAVAAPGEETVRPLVTAIPDAAVRAEAEVAARTFRPDDGRTTKPASTAGEEAAGPSASRPGKSGHWPLVAAAAVAGAVLVSVPLLSGGEKKTTDASDALDKVAVAGAGHGSGGATSAPVADGNAGADITFPAPTTPTAPARGGTSPTLPGGDRHGSASGTTTGHGDTAAGHPGSHGPGHPTARPSTSASPLHDAHTAPQHGVTVPRPAQEKRATGLASTPAASASGAGHAAHASTMAAARHAATSTATAPAEGDKAREPQASTHTTATASSHASAQTSHPQTSTASHASTQASTARQATTQAQPQTTARTAAAATPALAPASTQRNWSTKVVNATYVLHSGESVASDRMRITMRADGDLVISDEHGTIRWSSHTQGSGNYAVFQDDGNLAVYSANHTSLWTSGTAGNTGAELVIQSDGNVVILSRSGTAVWAAGTAH
ncbi:hypothetical protein [Streptomyces sp. NPDC004658]|uniref:hypothetical protein n=1 Tax=Streptomyces sp. NPDC004658 TaxID=3154672 RepID=UPI0033A5EB23